MHFLPWSKEYETGIREVDAQHEHIFYIIDQIFVAIEANKPQNDLQKLITDLADYAKWHVKQERDIVKFIHDLDTEFHQKRDHEFLEVITTCASEFRQNNTIIERLILQFLKSWVLIHIMIDDKDICLDSSNGFNIPELGY